MKERSGWAILIRVAAYRVYTDVLRWANRLEGRGLENAGGYSSMTSHLREHAVQRLVERYGIRFPKAYLTWCWKQIQDGLNGFSPKARRLSKFKNGDSIWEIDSYQGTVYAVHSGNLNEILTFLTKEMADNSTGAVPATEADIGRLKRHLENTRRSADGR